MKIRILFLFFLFPLFAQAQQSWSRVVPQISIGTKMITTRDGGYVVLGGEDEGQYKVPRVSKFNGQGQLLWSRGAQSRVGMRHFTGRTISEMHSGDIWLLGYAAAIPFEEGQQSLTFIQRLNPQTGDTLYTQYLPQSLGLDLKYLHATPEGDRVFGLTVKRFAENPDHGYFTITEYDERGSFVKETGHIIQTWLTPSIEFVSTAAGDLFLNTGYVKGSSPMEYSRFVKVIDKSKNTLQGLYDHFVIGAMPNGRILTAGPVGEKYGFHLFGATFEDRITLPDSFFSLATGEELYHTLPMPDGEFLVSGAYKVNTNTRALFLMKLDAQGNQVWKRYYPEESATGLAHLEVVPDGGALMLLRKDNEVRLVKIDNQGVILNSKKEQALANQIATLYPNPSNGNQIHLFFQQKFAGTVQVFDQTGKLQWQNNIDAQKDQQMTIPQTLATGLYQVLLTGRNGSVSSMKLLKN
ncbi:T9SS type A sorting domain-containing protein [Rufibacter sp. LB8]|uniref:T9SS type A sorting domain-containing protein n=1 Tax=Rufibacter sp. LB8 TaxID=2777781 RepID=UPI00178C537B|nr:T9SS type A sorting domain-containing protein [Rufibacter sp. LB8]